MSNNIDEHDILDESHHAAKAIVDAAERQGLPPMRRLKLIIGFAFCKWFGIHEAVSVYVADRVGRRLEEEIFRTIENSDTGRRYYTLQLSDEIQTKALDGLGELVRRSFAAERIERANLQKLVAVQGDRIAIFHKRMTAEAAKTTAQYEQLHRRIEALGPQDNPPMQQPGDAIAGCGPGDKSVAGV